MEEVHCEEACREGHSTVVVRAEAYRKEAHHEEAHREEAHHEEAHHEGHSTVAVRTGVVQAVRRRATACWLCWWTPVARTVGVRSVNRGSCCHAPFLVRRGAGALVAWVRSRVVSWTVFS